jgi:outer membrane protein
MLMLLVGSHSPVFAAGFPDVIQDPLLASPPVLSTNAALPDEAAPIVCPAAIDLNHPLALGDAVDASLCNNPQLRETWAAIKVQASEVGLARAAYLPTISTTISHLQTNTSFPSFPAADTNVKGISRYESLTWRLFDFGGRAANREAANQMLVSALASHDAAIQKDLATVIGAYFEAMTAKSALESRNTVMTLAQSTLSATQRREKKGVAALSDTLQAKTALAKAELAKQRAEGDLRKAKADLVLAVGVSPTSVIQLPNNVDSGQPDTVKDLQQWLTEAEVNHPAIVAAKAQWDADKAKIKAARAAALPTIDFSANHYDNGYPNQGLSNVETKINTIGVSLTIPIFEGFSSTYKIREAEAQAEKSEAQLHDTEHQILTEIVKAHADAMSALQDLNSSENLVSAAQASVQSSQRRYEKGEADVLELLSTQAAFADAEQERVRCIAEWRSARLRLLADAGVLNHGSVLGP